MLFCFDLKKDTVDHNILFKIKSRWGNARKWFSSYLTERNQFVDVYGIFQLRKLSDVVCHGVPFLDHYCLLCVSMICQLL